jgi:hypothetical protein
VALPVIVVCVPPLPEMVVSALFCVLTVVAPIIDEKFCPGCTVIVFVELLGST